MGVTEPAPAAPATPAAASSAAAAAPAAGSGGRRASYWTLWRGVPRELFFLLLGFPIALAGFVVTITLFVSGVGSIVTFFLGVVLIIAALYVSRGFGVLELARLELAGRPPITRPEWQDARARQGFFGWLRSVLGNGHYWLYLLHTMVISFAVSLFTWIVTVAALSVALGGATYWVWGWFPGDGGREVFVSGWLLDVLRVDRGGVDLRVLDAIAYVVIGFVLLALLPFITHGLTVLHDLIARGVLGAFRSDALQREVIAANQSRGSAVAAEGQALRRLERDIHDGPQQRLVRLQMDLAAADRQIASDPDLARATIAEALEQSREALEELRSLSRGFAPPILLDRGLVAALESAATRSPVPVRVVSSLPDGVGAIPQEIERNAYFVASEAITNAVKHSGASLIEVRLELRRTTDGGAPARLGLTVTDDGRGGAIPVPGHGIAGLEERLRGLGGTLTLDSPVGGPTVVAADIPIWG